MIVLAGHHHDRLDALIELYEQNKPNLDHEVLVVCNNEVPYRTHLPSIQTANDHMRDIGMYEAALKAAEPEWAFFLNDDVVVMEGDWYGEASRLMARGARIVGAQPNQSAVMTREGRIKMWQDGRPGQPLPDYLVSDEAYKEMRKLRFIRTHAFACTRRYFGCILQAARNGGEPMNANAFEHNTITSDTVPHFLSSPTMLMDRNTAPYKEYFHDQPVQR